MMINQNHGLQGQKPSLNEVHDNGSPWWRDPAERAVQWLAEGGAPFTVDQVRDLGVEDPDHPNRWGGLFAAMRARGVIVPLGYTTSKRPSRHHAVLRVWQGVAA